VKSGACVRNVHDTHTIHSAIRDRADDRADIVVSIAGCVAPVPLHCAVSRYALCKKSQFIFLYLHCALLDNSGTGARHPAIETTMSARSRIALWMVCVSCTFLTQAPLFTHSLSNAAYIVPPCPHQPAAIRLALGAAFSQCINPARRLITAQRRWCCTQGAKVDP